MRRQSWIGAIHFWVLVLFATYSTSIRTPSRPGRLPDPADSGRRDPPGRRDGDGPGGPGLWLSGLHRPGRCPGLGL